MANIITELHLEMSSNWYVTKKLNSIGRVGENTVTKLTIEPTEIINNVTYEIEIADASGSKNVAELTIDGTELYLILTANMLTTSGIMKMQVRGLFTDGSIKKSNIFELKVNRSISATEHYEEYAVTIFDQLVQDCRDIIEGAESYAVRAETAAVNAEAYEQSASASAEAASASATAAATSATAASNSAASATTSASNAATSETNAAASASSASTSAANANTSATNAANSATSAATSATNAHNSEVNASTSETNASTSATEAAASAESIAASVAQINENTYRINDLEAIIAGYQLADLPTGAVASITDGTALLMPSLKIGIEPVQDLHGYDHPWAGGAGKNLYGGSALKSSLLTVTGASEGSDGNGDFVNIPRSTALNDVILFDGFEENQQYTIIFKILPSGSAPSNIRIYYSDNSYYTITASADETLTTVTYTTEAGKTVSSIKLGYWYLCTCKIYYENCGVFVGANQTFEPYSNICPIEGWTAANVNVSPTTSAEDGTTYTIEFKDGDNPLAVYGGTLDVTSGELTVTDAHIASYESETLPSTWISDRDVYAEGTTPTTGAEVVYKLANSATYQLTPTQVRTLVGNNNIWADTGDVLSGKYYRSPF